MKSKGGRELLPGLCKIYKNYYLREKNKEFGKKLGRISKKKKRNDRERNLKKKKEESTGNRKLGENRPPKNNSEKKTGT
jgi:hypothetical protein